MASALRTLAALLPLLQHAAGIRVQPQQHMGQRWDLQTALADQPPGAYFQLMRPVVAAITIAYCHMDAEEAATQPCTLPKTINAEYSEGGTWERMPAFEQNPDTGVANFALVDHGAKRALLVFKGSCHNPKYKQCRADSCFLGRSKTFGDASDTVIAAYGESPKKCKKEFTEVQMDYVSQARNLTRNLQDHLGPEYAILLTGHSMGGLLSMVLAMEQPDKLQAFTFSPSPFHLAAMQALRITEEQLKAIPGVENRVAVGDPYDLLPNTMLVPLAREGALSCVYDDWDNVEPKECMKKDVKHDIQAGKMGFLTSMGIAHCKKAAHEWERYTNLTLRRQKDNVTPLSLPNCSRSFSELTPQLLETAAL